MGIFEQYLGAHAFFEGIAKQYLAILGERTVHANFSGGEFLFHAGTPANQFYLVQHGKVALQLSAPGMRTSIMQTIGDNEVIGWSWFFPPYQWHFDAKALVPTRTLALDGEWLRQMCEEDHELGYLIMKRVANVLVERLQNARLQMLDFYGNRS